MRIYTWLHREGRLNIVLWIDIILLKMYKKSWFTRKCHSLRTIWTYMKNTFYEVLLAVQREGHHQRSPKLRWRAKLVPKKLPFSIEIHFSSLFSNFLSNHRWKTEYFIDVLTQKGCSKVYFLFCKNALDFGWSHERAKCIQLILR